MTPSLYKIITLHLFLNRDAKGWKVSGNFGNFPWKVLGILKGWQFSEILEIFNLDLFSTFYEIFCTKNNRTKLAQICSALTIQCTGSALLFGQFASLYGFIERTTRLNNQVRLDLICYFLRKLIFYAFPVLLLGFQQNPRLKTPKMLFEYTANLILTMLNKMERFIKTAMTKFCFKFRRLNLYQQGTYSYMDEPFVVCTQINQWQMQSLTMLSK